MARRHAHASSQPAVEVTAPVRCIDVERRHHRGRQVDQAALDEGVVRDAERHDVLGALLLGSLSLVVNFDAPEAAADLRQLAGVAALQSLRPIAAGIHIAAFRLPPATTLNPGTVVSANRSKGGTEVPHPHAHTPGPGRICPPRRRARRRRAQSRLSCPPPLTIQSSMPLNPAGSSTNFTVAPR